MAINRNDLLSLHNVATVLALSEVFLRLLAQGSTTVQRLRDIAATEGATPEELAAMDKKLSDAISRREAEAERARLETDSLT